MRGWLPDSHLVWLVIEAVEQLDTSAFHRRSKLGGVGRAGFDPDMLLTLLVYGYCVGARSSRQIERLCEVDVAFRVASADDRPDHSTLARFRQAHDEAFVALFTQVLMLAAAAGLGRFGTVAIDGTKLAANASVDANRDERWLREQERRLRGQAERLVAEAAAVDAAEDAEIGQARGDELPEELADPDRRPGAVRAALADLEKRRRAEQDREQAEQDRERAEQDRERAERDVERRAAAVRAALADLEERRRAAEERERAEKAAARARAEERLRRWAAGERPGTGPVEVDRAVAVAEARLARAIEEQQAKIDKAAAKMAALEGGRPPGRLPVPVEQHGSVVRARGVLERARQRLARREEKRAQAAVGKSRPRANLTDPQSRLMPTRKGWIQGYNAQFAVTADQLIIAIEVTQSTEDWGWLAPMMATAAEAAGQFRERGRDDAEIGTILADAGYASTENLTCEGPDRLIALGKGRAQHQAAITEPAVGKPPDDASAREAMEHRLRTPDGAALYRRRGATVEPAIGNLKKIIDRLSRRGLPAAQAELHLACAAFNLLKIFRADLAT
jgi:transposase